MQKLFMKQKVFSLGGKFTIKNEAQEDIYFVEGSLMKIVKSFKIYNNKRDEVGIITRKVFSLLPTFFIDVPGEEVIKIKKSFTFLKAKYEIESAQIQITGDWWDMNFQVLQNGKQVASIRERWLVWGDTYELDIYDETLEKLVVAIVVAIDYVKAMDRKTASILEN